jgi:hypothetical protein
MRSPRAGGRRAATPCAAVFRGLCGAPPRTNPAGGRASLNRRTPCAGSEGKGRAGRRPAVLPQEFLRSNTYNPKIRMDADFWKAKAVPAGTAFARARDRSGIKTRRVFVRADSPVPAAGGDAPYKNSMPGLSFFAPGAAPDLEEFRRESWNRNRSLPLLFGRGFGNPCPPRGR